MLKKAICALIVISIFFMGNIFAGGWPQPKGGYFIKLSEWWIVSDQHFDNAGKVIINTHEFGYYSTSLFAEYGFTDRLTGILYFPFLNYTYSLPPSQAGKLSAWAIGDMDIGIKMGLTNNTPVALSMTLLLGIPIGKERGSITGGLQTGDGEWNQTLTLDAGTGFKIANTTGWINLHSGYNHRSSGYADEFLYGLEGGIHVSKNQITLVARVSGVNALGSGDSPLNPQSLFSNEREYLSLSPEIIYHFNEFWGLTAGIGTAFSGKNIFANTSFTIGVFIRRQPARSAKVSGQTEFSLPGK